MIQVNTIQCGDCLEVMKNIDNCSIDLVLCDLPYGSLTQNSWDKLIDPVRLWEQYRRIIKNNGAIVLTGQGKFSARMIMTAEDIYRYSLVWKKNKPRGFLNAKKQFLRVHENIDIFYQSQPTYNPQKTSGHKPVNSYTKNTSDGTNYGKTKLGIKGGGSTDRYPTSVISIPVVNNEDKDKYAPTQKPVALGEYLIKTFSNEGDLILDNACGSGSFLVAAKKCKRNFIGIDNDEKMCMISQMRTNKDYVI